jgi:phosphoserine aminotransferase
MNLLRGKSSIDFIDTGEWSKKSIKEAAKYAKANIAASGKEGNFTAVPPREGWKLDPNAAYVHICSNETIGGVEYHWTPDVGSVPLVADMSSNFLSQAGRRQQVRPDLRRRAEEPRPGGPDHRHRARRPDRPGAADHAVGLRLQAAGRRRLDAEHAAHLRDLHRRAGVQVDQAQGGLAAMAAHNQAKAALLYDYLDRSAFYVSPVAKADRSLMNVPFKLKDESLDAAFLKGAEGGGMLQLKGHRSVGGMRASIYNAMPVDGVKALVAYMKEFEAKHG